MKQAASRKPGAEPAPEPQQLPLGFVGQPLMVALERLLPVRKEPLAVRGTRKSQQLKASIEAVGLIEPLSVAAADKAGMHVLLDGHLRLTAAQMLEWPEIAVLVASDDEGYTYNSRVNRLSTIQETHMLRRTMAQARGPRSDDVQGTGACAARTAATASVHWARWAARPTASVRDRDPGLFTQGCGSGVHDPRPRRAQPGAVCKAVAIPQRCSLDDKGLGHDHGAVLGPTHRVGEAVSRLALTAHGEDTAGLVNTPHRLLA